LTKLSQMLRKRTSWAVAVNYYSGFFRIIFGGVFGGF